MGWIGGLVGGDEGVTEQTGEERRGEERRGEERERER